MKANFCPLCESESVNFRKTNCECSTCKSVFIYTQFHKDPPSNGRTDTKCIVCGSTAQINSKQQINCNSCRSQYYLTFIQVTKKSRKLRK